MPSVSGSSSSISTSLLLFLSKDLISILCLPPGCLLCQDPPLPSAPASSSSSPKISSPFYVFLQDAFCVRILLFHQHQPPPLPLQRSHLHSMSSSRMPSVSGSSSSISTSLLLFLSKDLISI